MARRIDTRATRALPSREAVLAFIRETPGKVGKREIAKAFGLKAGDRIWLKQMLKEHEARARTADPRAAVTAMSGNRSGNDMDQG